MRSLSRLMPNLHGPREKQRRLYANVISSIALYGSPIWADALAASRHNIRRLRGVQKLCSIRAICAYRTVSYDAACLLARSPPFMLLAFMRKRIFHRLVDLRECADWSLDMEKEIRSQEYALMLRQWKLYLENPNLPGVRTREAIILETGFQDVGAIWIITPLSYYPDMAVLGPSFSASGRRLPAHVISVVITSTQQSTRC